MNAVAKDIIHFNTGSKDLTYNAAIKIFYSIMRKHGIKFGTKNKNNTGYRGANFEWTMCKTLFLEIHRGNIQITDLFKSELPKDLVHY